MQKNCETKIIKIKAEGDGRYLNNNEISVQHVLYFCIKNTLWCRIGVCDICPGNKSGILRVTVSASYFIGFSSNMKLNNERI